MDDGLPVTWWSVQLSGDPDERKRLVGSRSKEPAARAANLGTQSLEDSIGNKVGSHVSR